MKTFYNRVVDDGGAAILLVVAIAAGLLLPTTGRAAAPVVTSLGAVSGSFRSPARVATDAAGILYVSDPLAGTVSVLDASGRENSVLSGLGQPLGLAVDGTGRIYVGDAQTGAVTVYDALGLFLYQLGQGPGEFQLPGHLAVATANGATTVFVSDGLAHVVKAYRDGMLVGQFGSFGLGPNQFDFPAGLCLGPDGNLFVVDQNNNRVQVLDQSGNFLGGFTLQVAPHFGNSGRGQGITSDAQGRLYVVDVFQGRVSMFDSSGAYLGLIGGYGNGVGQFRLPGGIVLDRQSRLWVANTGNARLEGFGLDCYVQPAVSPASQNVSVGTTVTFTVNAGCTAAGVTYQWRKDSIPLTDGGIVSGATNATLRLAGVTVSQSGNYSVVVTTASGPATTGGSKLTVTAAPVITSSPVSRPAGRGTTATFSVVASGAGLTYRWFYNGIELAAPNSNTLVLTNVQDLMAGTYWAVVTNAAGTATSAQATLTVVVAPAIITGPATQTVPERGTANFSVVATGVMPLRYQWYRVSTALANQTNATLTLTNVTPASNSTYYVQVSNTSGSTNSTAATLTVTPDTVPPAALVAYGGAVTNRTILVSFSENLTLASAQQASNYQLIGPGGLTVLNAVLTNGSRVLLTLSSNRNATADYALRIQNVTDAAYTPNVMSPNPTVLSVVNSDTIGTVAWWPLDDATGTTARDLSGGGFNGTLENATWTTGRSGSSVNLNGTTGDVVIPALNLYTNTVTISAWVRRSGTQSNLAGIFFSRAGSSIAGLQFGGTNELRYNWNNVAAATNFSSGLVVPDATWTFVALVLDPTSATFYLNSGSGWLSVTNVAAHTLEEFNGVSYLGWDPAASTRRFKGALDDVRICNRALSATDIQTLYNAVAAPVTCVISSPANGSILTTASATILASVTANGNTINKVDFFSGSTFLGAVRNAPYSMVWNNLVSGAYSLQARVWYGPANYSVTSPVANFTVAIPITSTLTLLGGTLTLQWSGGVPPYQVQVTTNLAAAVWENAGPATTNTSMTLLPNSEAAFYRVAGH